MAVAGGLELFDGTAPTNPPAGYEILYVNAGVWYSLNSAGVSTPIADVTSLTVDNTSIINTGTSTAPSIRTGTLDAIATAYPVAASIPLNGHKIVNLANGSAASDAAAFGQIPTVFASSVTAGDASLSISPTTGAVVAESGTLDKVANLHPPVANWSNNSNKITAVTQGSSAGEVVVFPVPLTSLAAEAANTVVANMTGGSAVPTATATTGTGSPVASINSTQFPRDIEGIVFVDTVNSQGWAGADAGAWVNSAYAYGNTTYGNASESGGFIIELAPCTPTHTTYTFSTPIVLANATNLTCCWLRGAGDGNGASVLNYTATSGIAISIGGGSGNDGGVQLSDFTLLGTAQGNGATGIQVGILGTAGSSGATMKNVSVRRFTNGITQSLSSSSYSLNLDNVKVQQCTNGYTPAGENNVMKGGLLGGNATGLVGSNTGTEVQMFGTAFDDNTTTGINVSTATCRVTMDGCRFENVGGGTDNYVTVSAGAVLQQGGAMSNDLGSGTSTGFVQVSGTGNYVCTGTWIFSVSGRTYTQVFNNTGTLSVLKADPVIGSTSTGISQTNMFTAGSGGKVIDWFRVWNRSTANQTATMVAGTSIYVVNSNLKMPIGAVLKVNTLLEWRIFIAKTAAGTTAFTFPLFIGTNGSLSDTSVSTANTMGFTQTAAVDNAEAVITFLVTTVGASATGTWGVTMNHSAASGTGFGPTTALISATGTLATTFNSTTAGLQFGIAINSQTGTPVVAVSCPSAKVYDLS